MRYPITKFLEGHGKWWYVNSVKDSVWTCGCVSCDPGCTYWRIVINAWETWTVAAADGVRCASVRWEINFLLTFETAPFFCVYPVLLLLSQEFAVDLGRFFALRKADRPLFATSHRCVPFKKYMGLKCSCVLCVWDNTVIFCSVIFC
jgi:hypothetical protein